MHEPDTLAAEVRQHEDTKEINILITIAKAEVNRDIETTMRG